MVQIQNFFWSVFSDACGGRCLRRILFSTVFLSVHWFIVLMSHIHPCGSMIDLFFIQYFNSFKNNKISCNAWAIYLEYCREKLLLNSHFVIFENKISLCENDAIIKWSNTDLLLPSNLLKFSIKSIKAWLKNPSTWDN